MKKFNTIHGFLTKGEDDPDEIIIKYAASIRIGGDSLDFSTIEQQLNIQATKKHVKGEIKGETRYSDDMWLYETRNLVSEDLHFEFHLNHINALFLPHIEYLKYLKSDKCNIQIYLDFYTNLDIGGVEIPINCLQLYTALEIPFGFGYNFIGSYS